MITKLIAPTNLLVSRGQCRPFGATLKSRGVNFAVFSRHARAVSLVFFMEGREEPLVEIALDPTINKTGDVWHIFVHDLSLDLLYGYRVDGVFTPEKGHRFNPRVVLLDPHARAISGGHHWGVPEVPYGKDSGQLTRRSRLVTDDFDWEGDHPLSTPMSRTVIYELHVRGFTQHPSSAVRHPGTFLGLCEKIPHLKALGVTAVQLMPVMEFDELDCPNKHPVTGERLRNYWGYNTLSFFAPKSAYAAEAGNQVNEFKQMVKTFHAAGLEVILDVVYNHTSEGSENGPTLSFRGLDNSIYYMHDRQGKCLNYSGCGNTVKCNHPLVRDLIIESLVYWVAEMHVDGFRFDLASILGRGVNGEVLTDPPPAAAHRRTSAIGRHQAPGRGVGRGWAFAGRAIPSLGSLGGVQRLLPRRRAPLYSQRGGHDLGGCSPDQRQSRHLPGLRPSVSLDQLRDLPRRLHAQRPRFLQPQT